MTKKIVTVLGARPQFIKASVVSYALRSVGAVQEVLVHTGQHFDENMSRVFFDELGMARPAYHLGIHGGTHGLMTGQMLAEVERVLLTEKPDAVLVYGDTNSTLAGALAAAKLHLPIAHVEAGLRSFNMRMPEEINRVLTDRISRWLFAPTDVAVANLLREGMAAAQVVQTGDVMYDVAMHYGARVGADGRIMAQLQLPARRFVLATVHRAENTDDEARLEAIVHGLQDVAGNMPVVWPMHPRTRRALEAKGTLERLARYVHIIAPLGYLDMVQLEKHAAVIATDSGGVQKEAFFYRVPCVTLREETEWVELVKAKWNRLVTPLTRETVSSAILSAVDTAGSDVSPYGSGDAAIKSVEHLCEALGA